MAKRKAGKSPIKTEKVELFPAQDQEEANEMIAFFLYWSKDRDGACDWLGALFRDYWVLGGIFRSNMLFFEKPGHDLLIAAPDPLAGHGAYGSDAPKHPRAVSSALKNAVRAVALQPAMIRAVNGPASSSRVLRVLTIYGEHAYRVNLDDFPPPEAVEADFRSCG